MAASGGRRGSVGGIEMMDDEVPDPMKKPQRLLGFFADRTGLEPATSAVTGRHSNQLNYRSFSVGAAKIGEFSF